MLKLIALIGMTMKASAYSGPAPRRFFVEPKNFLDVATASVQLVTRLGSGALVSGWTVNVADDDDKDSYSIARGFGKRIAEGQTGVEQPSKPIELYEFETCPFCRKVREAVSILDLDVTFYPTPKNGPRFRPLVGDKGGKQQFPYLIDRNTNVEMYESNDIINYLYKEYGKGAEPPSSLTSGLAVLSAGLGMLPRAGKGGTYRGDPSKQPKKPLIFYGYEASPFCKLVKERLCELELPHVLKTCARGSPTRQELLDKTGYFVVPYIEDPNTNTEMFESADILNYLDTTYAAA